MYGYGDTDVFLFKNPTLSYSPPTNNAPDSFTVRINSFTGNIDILNAGGQVVSSQPLASTPSVVINGEDGQDDVLTLDFTNGNPLPPGGLTFNGGAGGGIDGLIIRGTGTQDGR